MRKRNSQKDLVWALIEDGDDHSLPELARASRSTSAVASARVRQLNAELRAGGADCLIGNRMQFPGHPRLRRRLYRLIPRGED